MPDRENSIRRLASERLGGLSSFARPLTVFASPAWRGIEADIWLAEGPRGTAIYKHYHDDISGYVDVAAALEATEAAGRLGVGPKVLESRSDEGVLVLAHLGEGWRAGGLQDAADPEIRSAVIARKKAFQAGPLLSRDDDIVADIARLHRLCGEAGARLSQNIAAFLDFAALAGQALSAHGADRVASHRDGDTSNLMIGPEGEVRLLDFDLAANAETRSRTSAATWSSSSSASPRRAPASRNGTAGSTRGFTSAPASTASSTICAGGWSGR